ncbi:hypothetical protein Zmor_008133 [Zophobas morio]|uniref:Anamorsin C-terminal domain-containing protein n=1 Tax=Zophobas morio TaxID=2755281 RepID=A0AA38IZ11_9CUCU|nr:hypothetical protein Zmor_008133 [Zophobas morio]
MSATTSEKKKRLLIIYDDRIYDEPPQSPISETLALKQISDLKQHETKTVLLRIPEEKLTDCVLKRVFSTSKLGGKVVATCIEKGVDDVVFNLKVAGFVNVEVKTTNSGTNVFGFKPTYEIGICTRLRKRKHRDWINLANQELDEVSDPDDLLDEKDFKKPKSAALLCGTTEKPKAWKIYGPAEEVTKEGQKLPRGMRSSCGNCFLADAFYRAGCRQRGLPGNKPGKNIPVIGFQL